MDQIRKILAWLKQYHFWVLCVLVALIPLLCWWSGAGALSKQYKENETKITGGFQTVTSVKSDPFHPNEEISKRQTDETNKLSAEVQELWQKLYDAQREHVLKWPSELNAQFRDTVEKLEFGQDIPDDKGLREHYQSYIEKHFPKLPEKIGARPIDETQAGTLGGGGGGFSRRGEGTGGAMTMGGELNDDNDYICEWASEDQAAVRTELEFPQTPSALRIWCTQENLWVYHALLDVIKNTNEAAHATRMSNAAVRAVYSLQVGQPAAKFSRTPNRIYQLPTAAPSAEAGVGEQPIVPSGDPEGRSSEFPGGGEFTSGLAEGGTGEMSPEQEFARLFSGRYLGEDGKPIPAAGGGAAATDPSAPADPNAPAPAVDLTLFGKEYKRLPVRMVLEMDQRHLPRLIAECAIRPLQIEVQEVRVNAADAMGGAGGGGMPGMRGGFSEGGGMGGGNLIPDLTGLQSFNPHPEIVTVAIQGVIYIFNKPNTELLKPTTDGEPLVQTQ